MIEWLEDWFSENCNEDWEHLYGIKIETVDNPGWYIEFDIKETDYESIDFDRINIRRSENDWVICYKDNGCIKGTGGVRNLKELLAIIKNWITQNR